MLNNLCNIKPEQHSTSKFAIANLLELEDFQNCKACIISYSKIVNGNQCIYINKIV